MKPILYTAAALLTAVLLMLSLSAGLRQEKAAVLALTSEVDESIAAWQGINERKEALLTQLTEAQNSLREATLSLEEDTARISGLKPQIEELNAANAALQNEIAAAQALHDNLTHNCSHLRTLLQP